MDCVTYIKLVRSLAELTDALEALSDKLVRLEGEEAWDLLRAVLAEYNAKNVEFRKIDDAIRLYDPAQVPSTP
jgi:hypothetical protein